MVEHHVARLHLDEVDPSAVVVRIVGCPPFAVSIASIKPMRQWLDVSWAWGSRPPREATWRATTSTRAGHAKERGERHEDLLPSREVYWRATEDHVNEHGERQRQVRRAPGEKLVSRRKVAHGLGAQVGRLAVAGAGLRPAHKPTGSPRCRQLPRRGWSMLGGRAVGERVAILVYELAAVTAARCASGALSSTEDRMVPIAVRDWNVALVDPHPPVLAVVPPCG